MLRKIVRALSLSLIIATLYPASLFSQAAASGGDAVVPDLETRIGNSGTTVPTEAIPAISPPSLPDLPKAEPGEQVPAPMPSASVSPATASVPAPSDAGDFDREVPAPPSESGSIGVTAGAPNFLSGRFSFLRAAGDRPGFFLDFSGESASGYGGHSQADGFFDRSAQASAGIFGDYWSASATATSRTDGLQGKNDRYEDIVRRDLLWSLGAANLPLGGSPFSLTATGAGEIFTAFAEDSSMGVSSLSAISDATGYRLEPFAALSFLDGSFSADLSGSYAYETIDDFDELNAAATSLSLRYARSVFALSASVGVAGDDADGILVPFSVGFTASGGNKIPSLREIRLVGGIDRYRSSPYDLSSATPFADPRGPSAYAADWNASGGFTLSPVGDFGESGEISLSGDATFRRSLSGRGLYAVTDFYSSSGLIAVDRVERTSFATKASARYSVGVFETTAGWSAEWADRLYRESVQSIDVGAAARGWGSAKGLRASLDGSFPIDRAAMPDMSARVTYQLIEPLSVSLSINDAIPLVTGKTRYYNDLYAERGGTISLSAEAFF